MRNIEEISYDVLKKFVKNIDSYPSSRITESQITDLLKPKDINNFKSSLTAIVVRFLIDQEYISLHQSNRNATTYNVTASGILEGSKNWFQRNTSIVNFAIGALISALVGLIPVIFEKIITNDSIQKIEVSNIEKLPICSKREQSIPQAPVKKKDAKAH